MEPTRLKTVVFTSHPIARHAQNTAQQIMLLKALQITQDPQQLRQMIGVRTVTDVWRTLDKLSMRKEFHKALNKQGISFDFIVRGLKDLVDTGTEKSKLGALQTLLKSIGMDKYDGEAIAGTGSWEEALLAKLEKEKEEKKTIDPVAAPLEIEEPVEYDVVQPVIPESVRKSAEEEAQMLSTIYDPK